MKSKIIRIVLIIIIALTFSIEVQASLSVHPESIRDTVLLNQNKTTILHITNSTGILGYQLSSEATWISFSSDSGNINAGDTINITVTFLGDLINNGINTATIILLDPHHGPINIPVEVFGETSTEVSDNFSQTAMTFQLFQNYPNPFNPSTSIRYSLPETQNVIIKIYNILGKEMATIVNEEKIKGSYLINFNMNDYPSGVYLYSLKTPKYSATRKMILIK